MNGFKTKFDLVRSYFLHHLSISREQPSTFTETLKNFFTKNKRLQSYGGMIKYYMVMYINIKNVLECN